MRLRSFPVWPIAKGVCGVTNHHPSVFISTSGACDDPHGSSTGSSGYSFQRMVSIPDGPSGQKTSQSGKSPARPVAPGQSPNPPTARHNVRLLPAHALATVGSAHNALTTTSGARQRCIVSFTISRICSSDAGRICLPFLKPAPAPRGSCICLAARL
jgi:hypothetical protein